ncbi:MAG: dihydropteroate synthase [Bryobacterales bacterium]|nr:dihydropteroate synthase [Bryobacterales bacterium]
MAFQRTKALWRIGDEEVTLGIRTLLAGRIEIFRGPHHDRTDPYEAADTARKVEESGADIVEINPGPRNLKRGLPSADHELSALVPVLKKLMPFVARPISVVTPNAETARRAVELGASIIHDPSGLAFDKKLAPTVNESKAALILGHMRGTPEQWARMEPLTRLSETVRVDLRASLIRARQAGIEPRRIVLDAGLEHGKRSHENFTLLRSLGSLCPRGQGIQANLASKSFLLGSVRGDAGERAASLAVAATLALESGAHMLTVEHPGSVRDFVAVVDRIYREDEQADLAE